MYAAGGGGGGDGGKMVAFGCRDRSKEHIWKCDGIRNRLLG